MKLLLYCTKSKPYIAHQDVDYDCDDTCCSFAGYLPFTRQELYDYDIPLDKTLNGKIVAECDFEVKTFNYFHALNALMDNIFMQREMFEKVDYSHKDLKDLLNKSCLTYEQLAD